jgi:hypothetical protein
MDKQGIKLQDDLFGNFGYEYLIKQWKLPQGQLYQLVPCPLTPFTKYVAGTVLS